MRHDGRNQARSKPSLQEILRRAADVAIGVTASTRDALLVTRNEGDLASIPDLRLEALST